MSGKDPVSKLYDDSSSDFELKPDDRFLPTKKRVATSNPTGSTVTAVGPKEKPTAALSDKPEMVVAFYGKFGERTHTDLHREAKEVNVAFSGSFKLKKVTHIVTREMADIVKQSKDVRDKELWSLEKWDNFVKDAKKNLPAQLKEEETLSFAPEKTHVSLLKPPTGLQQFSTGQRSTAAKRQRLITVDDKEVQLVLVSLDDGEKRNMEFWFKTDPPFETFVIKPQKKGFRTLRWIMHVRDICCANFNDIGFELLWRGDLIAGIWSPNCKDREYFGRNIMFYQSLVPKPPSFNKEAFYFYATGREYEVESLSPKLEKLKSVVKRCDGTITTLLKDIRTMNITRGVVWKSLDQKYAEDFKSITWMKWDEFLEEYKLTAIFS